ncbi:YoaK family protein [Streptomyces sp. TP-A0874]|uniref:YoaK family protein n=1 Tax=Streptomyces sp. TP-A0874 TaxID=549819 RepID=UPI000853943A|nr:YoaK family protein [Streptomyces sp. TP-A0874]
MRNADRTAPQRAHRAERVALVATLALTFVTGIVDAVGFVGLDRVFVGNMTGNIVVLGMGVAGADRLPVLGPAVALCAFAAGAFLGGLLLRGRGKGWNPVVSVVLGSCGCLLMLLGGCCLVPAVEGHRALELTAVSVTAGVMGVQAAAARSLAVRDVTTVVVTSTLTALASESITRGGRHSLLNRRLGAILLIFSGAVFGVLLLELGLAVPLFAAGALTAATACVGHTMLPPQPPAREPTCPR